MQILDWRILPVSFWKWYWLVLVHEASPMRTWPLAPQNQSNFSPQRLDQFCLVIFVFFHYERIFLLFTSVALLEIVFLISLALWIAQNFKQSSAVLISFKKPTYSVKMITFHSRMIQILHTSRKKCQQSTSRLLVFLYAMHY